MQSTLERLRQRRQELGKEQGFTLIELLIVIVILGILAAIVVFAVQNLTGSSAQAACQANYKTIETAAEAYKAQEATYPADITALTSKATDGNGPWLKDTPPVAGGTSPYYFALDPANDAVQVGTDKTHGASATNAAADGNGFCSAA